MTLADVVALELSLLDPQVRRSPERVERLLHPDFREFGASGAAWDRAAHRTPHGVPIELTDADLQA